jgi:hypothetical protein
VLVLAALGGGYWFLSPSDDGEAVTLVMEPAGSMGANPFSDEPLADAPDPTIATKTTSTLPTSTAAVTTASTGTAPGLYGGTEVGTKCDAEAQIAFLKKNPGKAKAWLEALNSDPDLNWDGGKVQTKDIGKYIASLTPVILRQDTVVTNHGYLNGKLTKFQSVLQRGTAAMVDDKGVPRVRCYCGNPLAPPVKGKKSNTPPAKSKTPPPVKTKFPCIPPRPDSSDPDCEPTAKAVKKYEGESWDGFDPNNVAIVGRDPKPVKKLQVNIKGKNVTVPLGPSCATGAKCPELEKGYVALGKKAADVPTGAPGPKADGTKAPTADPTTAAPTNQAEPPLSTQKGTIAIGRTGKGGTYDGKVATRFYATLSGYSPNSRVTITCSDTTRTFDSFYWDTDASGNGVAGDGPWCESTDGVITFTDHLGGKASG